MQLRYLIIILIIPIIVRILESLNFYILLKAIRHKTKLLKLTKYLFYTWAVGAFTPGKMGQFAMVLFLNKEGVSKGESFMITVLDKFLTIIVLAGFGLLGLYHFFDGMQQLVIYLIIIGGLIILSLLMFNHKIKNYLKKNYFTKYSNNTNKMDNFYIFDLLYFSFIQLPS
jgi:uncharacterized membrane protein YbhN (UPF0104 family)